MVKNLKIQIAILASMVCCLVVTNSNSLDIPSLRRPIKSARLTADFITPPASLLMLTESLPVTTEDDSDLLVSSSSNNHTEIIGTTTEIVANSSGTESRLRWIDFGRHQGYPPKMPNVPGIPSGFRNPLATQPPAVSTSTTTTEATIESLPNMYNNNPAIANFFNTNGGSNSSPLGFTGNTVTLDEEILSNIPNQNRRYNITRVEHIVAECSDDYMKVVIRFNGSFTGLIYSSGYVHDPNCIYVNGSGRNHYEFFIRLNQCGTLGRQEMYHPSMPGEARRRDQLMWNTLSIQYNALIEEEFDEHFRLTCEYGSDFWKTVSFPAVNVEVNTGSPVVFTINPPQCQMEIRRGFGIAGTRTSGPVTVGDPLTLVIHMKSEKVGFDILVKNCIAHNGAQQRMQLIDANGCVTNDKLISPFRGTYNSENGHQVSLFAYLKAFRFTGSLALYLECDIHMCHNRCPPQRCYWRNLSKRSTELQTETATNTTTTDKPILSESILLSQALEVHHEEDASMAHSDLHPDEDLVCLRSGGLALALLLLISLMSISVVSSTCYCIRAKKLKYLERNIHFQRDCHRNITSTIGSLNSEASSIGGTINPYQERFFRYN